MKHRKQNVNMNNRRELLEFKILRELNRLPLESKNVGKANKVLLGKKISLKASTLTLESCW